MYLRETRQKRADGSVITHLQLAESTWNPDKGRSETRILYNCGRAEDPEVAERLRRLARSILRRASPDTQRDRVRDKSRSCSMPCTSRGTNACGRREMSHTFLVTPAKPGDLP